MYVSLVGEFGVVYKAYLTKKNQVITDTVAIKTLKGSANETSIEKLVQQSSISPT